MRMFYIFVDLQLNEWHCTSLFKSNREFLTMSKYIDFHLCGLNYAMFHYERVKFLNIVFERLVSVHVWIHQNFETFDVKMTDQLQLKPLIQTNNQNVTEEICPHELVQHHGQYRHKNRKINHFCQGPISKFIWTLIARFMRPTWGPSGADRTQVGPMLAPWTLLSGDVSPGITQYESPGADVCISLLQRNDVRARSWFDI